MKLRHLILLALIAALALSSCATTTAPDGSVTKAPDAPTISAVGQITSALIEALFPPPAAPVVTPAK
jgi:PBP1b-binding outer membrane lipoprotein LpoB